MVLGFELVEPIHVFVKAVRLTFVVAALFVLTVAAYSWRGAYLSHRVQQELATIPEEAGPGPGRLEPESLEVVEARKLLGEQLAWIAAHMEIEGEWFGAPYTLTADHAQALAQGVVDRASFYEELDGLPGALWVMQAAAADAPFPRLRQHMAMRNALSARAWLAAQESGGEYAAGRDLARALAIARVTATARP